MNTGASSSLTQRRVPLWLAVLVCAAVLVLIGFVRLVVLSSRIVAFADGLWLLIFLWLRDRRLLWSMAAAMVGMTLVKIFFIVPHEAIDEPVEWFGAAMSVINILAPAVVVHAWLGAHDRLEQKHADLQATYAELEAANEELAAHEEELSRQNEELQAQTEEMEQQAEELKGQAEELEQQQAELEETNSELTRRQQAQQIVLESSRWLMGEAGASEAMAQVCQAALRIMGEKAVAAAVVERRGEQLVVRAHVGFGPAGMVKGNWSFQHSLASLAMERGQTAYLRDVSLRDDLEMPQPVDGRPFRSLLATPLRVEGDIVGAVEVLSYEPHDWSEEEFRVIEWLASQSALVMEVIGHHEEMERRRREAEEESIRKTRFLAAVSHDVRTPTNAINLMAELLSRCARDPAKAGELPALASDLRSSARALVDLVSDVLDLSRFDSGKLEMREEAFSLSVLVDTEVRQLIPLARSQGLELTVDQRSPTIWLRSDRMKLARVVGNLIGNAVKFTERGSVKVQCHRQADGSVALRVIDTGVGIPPEHRDRIFDEFYQLRNPERDRTKGTGLGLAICKRLVDALGFSLSVESAVGSGSTFTITIPPQRVIPAPADAAGADAGVSAEPSAAALNGMRILLVEDHDATRRATARLLASEGAIVAQAENGRTAMHLMAHEAPQVMLLDLMLPDIDGSEVLKHARQCYSSQSLRILAVSGDVTAKRLQQVRDLGAEDLVAKPIDINELVKLLKRPPPAALEAH